jgi:hypothetical protein
LDEKVPLLSGTFFFFFFFKKKKPLVNLLGELINFQVAIDVKLADKANMTPDLTLNIPPQYPYASCFLEYSQEKGKVSFGFSFGLVVLGFGFGFGIGEGFDFDFGFGVFFC